MKKIIRSKLLLGTILSFVAFSSNAHESNNHKEENMTSIRQEISRLKDNLTHMVKDKKDQLVDKSEEVYGNIKHNFEKLNSDAKAKLQKQYDELTDEMKSLKDKGVDKKEEYYSNILDKLNKLNDQIEQETK